MKSITICLLALLCFAGCNDAPEDLPAEVGVIKMKDAHLYYESNGKGEPLILLHAGFLNTDMWDDQVPELSKHFQVITIDLPGHRATRNDTVRLYPADFISAVLDSLGLAKASIAGVSLGASCVMDYVLTRPERVNKAILVSSGIVGWENRFERDTAVIQFIYSFFADLDKKDTAAAAEKFTRFWFDGPFRTPQQVNDTARKYIYESTLSNIQQHKMRGWPTFADTAAIDHLANIKLPVLVINGDKDALLIGKTSDYMGKQIPGARRATIPGTGHMLNMEAPDEFNKIVLDFLLDKATIKK